MQLRSVGRSGLHVSPLGPGCNNSGRRIDHAASQAVVHKALDLGVTVFDTADVYRSGIGGSEEFLGRDLGPQRKDVVLATKVDMAMDAAGALRSGGGTLRGGSRRYLIAAVEASLRRLGTDRIDLCQQHQLDPLLSIAETLRAVDDLRCWMPMNVMK
jgi:aryl-alcohol dehydrogenase-like predicted oxidoreductase